MIGGSIKKDFLMAYGITESQFSQLNNTQIDNLAEIFKLIGFGLYDKIRSYIGTDNDFNKFILSLIKEVVENNDDLITELTDIDEDNDKFSLLMSIFLDIDETVFEKAYDNYYGYNQIKSVIDYLKKNKKKEYQIDYILYYFFGEKLSGKLGSIEQYKGEFDIIEKEMNRKISEIKILLDQNFEKDNIPNKEILIWFRINFFDFPENKGLLINNFREKGYKTNHLKLDFSSILNQQSIDWENTEQDNFFPISEKAKIAGIKEVEYKTTQEVLENSLDENSKKIYRWLQKKLDDDQLKLESALAVGNCFFESIGIVLYTYGIYNNVNVNNLRNLLHKHLVKNKDLIYKNFDKETKDDYIKLDKSLINPESYVENNIQVAEMAKVLKRPIRVFYNQKNERDPDTFGSDYKDQLINLINFQKTKDGRQYQHYDALVYI